MTYLLDTTAFSALMRRDAGMRARFASLSPADRITICTITRGEVLYGLERLPPGRRQRGLEAEAKQLFSQLACLPVPETAGDRYAQIKRRAEQRGTPLDENDLWIAASAVAFGAVLVTRDSDFQRVNDLQVEDWA